MNIRKNKLKYTAMFLIAISIIAIFLMDKGYAIDIKQWHINNKELMEEHGEFVDIFKYLSWGITKLLAYLSSASEEIYNASFSFIDISSSDVVNNFIDSFRLAIIGLVAISILILAYNLIVNAEKNFNIVSNIAIFIIIVFGSTFIFKMGNDIIITIKDEVGKIKVSDSNNLTVSVINNNMIDLVKLSKDNKGLDKINFKNDSKSKKASYYGAGLKDISDLSYLKYDEVLNPDSDKYTYSTEGASKDILGANLRVVDFTNNVFYTKEADNGFGWNDADDDDFGNTFYYRYKQNTINTWLNLFSLIILYIAMAYKVIRIEYELIVSRLLSFLYASDVGRGEKIRKILNFVKDNYILLFICLISIKIYEIFMIYSSKNSEGFTQGIFSLFIAFCVIDGPNIVEKILGIDAGIRSSTARLMALGGMVLGAGKIGSRLAKAGVGAGLFAGRKAGAGAKKLLGAEGKAKGSNQRTPGGGSSLKSPIGSQSAGNGATSSQGAGSSGEGGGLESTVDSQLAGATATNTQSSSVESKSSDNKPNSSKEQGVKSQSALRKSKGIEPATYKSTLQKKDSKSASKLFDSKKKK